MYVSVIRRSATSDQLHAAAAAAAAAVELIMMTMMMMMMMAISGAKPVLNLRRGNIPFPPFPLSVPPSLTVA